MTIETAPCDNCGKPTPLHLLDAKPNSRHFSLRQLQHAADVGRDFSFLACRGCYGPGWLPLYNEGSN